MHAWSSLITLQHTWPHPTAVMHTAPANIPRCVHRRDRCFLKAITHAQVSPRRCQLQRQTSKKCNPLLRDTAHPGAASQHQQATVQLQKPHGAVFSQQDWNAEASPLLSSLGIATNTSPQQLWQHLSANSSTQEQQQQLQQQLQQHLDLPSCRLLLRAAAATCSTQQQYNQLRPLIQAATAVFPAFELGDFQLLLQLCAQARYVPDKEWLAAAIYADTGGFERLYQQSPAADVVHLFADLSAVFASHRQLFANTQQHAQLLQQQLQAENTKAVPVQYHELAAEAAALQAALEQSTANLLDIQQDRLIAGELSAVGGYWLVRRLLPQLTGGEHTAEALRGFGALPALRYQVLDPEEADVLLRLLTLHLPTWSPGQLAAALSSTLPCLGDHAPSDGQSLALLFDAAGAAAAAGMDAQEAGQLLLVLAQLPGYAPDAKVAQALLDCALQPPLALGAKQLYQLLSAASELGAAPRPQHMQQLQDNLKQ